MVQLEARDRMICASFDMKVFQNCRASSNQIDLICDDYYNKIIGGAYATMGCKSIGYGFRLFIDWYDESSVNQGLVNQLVALEKDWETDSCATFPGVIPMFALDNWMVGKSRTSDTKKNLQQLVLFPEYSFDAKFHIASPGDAPELKKTFSDMCRQIGCRFQDIYGWNPLSHVSSDFDKYLDPADLPKRDTPLYGVTASENDELEAFLIHTALAYFMSEGPTPIAVGNGDPDLLRCVWILDNALASAPKVSVSPTIASPFGKTPIQPTLLAEEDELDLEMLDVEGEEGSEGKEAI